MAKESNTAPSKSTVHTNYSYSIWSTLVTAAGLGLSLGITICCAIGWNSLPGWSVDLLYGTFGVSWISRLISGNGYFFMLLDKLFNNKTVPSRFAQWLNKRKQNSNSVGLSANNEPLKKRLNGQFWGLLLGLTVAVAVTALQIVFTANTSLPFFNILTQYAFGQGGTVAVMFSTSLLAVGNLSLFSGLGNRLGRFCDYVYTHHSSNKASAKSNKNKLQHKNINYVLSIAGGLLAGLGLVAAAVVVSGGFIAFTTVAGGPLMAGICIVTILSTSASASGYIGRAFDFLLGKRTLVEAVGTAIKPTEKNDNINQHALLNEGEQAAKAAKNSIAYRFKKNRSEHSGTIAGIIIGVALGAVLIASGGAAIALVIPLIFIKLLPVVVMKIMIMATAVSLFGGLGNRLGHTLDKKHCTEKVEESQPVQPSTPSSPDDAQAPTTPVSPSTSPIPQPAASQPYAYRTDNNSSSSSGNNYHTFFANNTNPQNLNQKITEDTLHKPKPSLKRRGCC